MSKKMVNALKAKVKELKHNDLKAKTVTSKGWNTINSGEATYRDLNRESGLAINGQKITNEFINNLYSKHKNLISKDEKRPFLKAVFTEMFEHADATVPNDSIIEELITHYNQEGYSHFFSAQRGKALLPFDLLILSSESEQRTHIDCDKPDCLKFSFSYRTKYVCNVHDPLPVKCNLCCSAEFQLKCKDGNVTYEDGKVLLTIPKELEDYRAGDDNLLDKLIDIVNKIIEYFKKLCEKLGFKFDTRIEYDSERNIKMGHSLGKPLKVVSEPDALSLGLGRAP
ncbi:hypothetical protein [Candidatus Wolbachia massiliensis]|uniref:Uncharacterized protein n=1 Tax=Candidatus Wolbachia massiliensis TaxID=1845000 RepID=A0A7L7YLQ0_9RICK|nr:hypothetical protein [Candidatus Wolbachia massiliensis]QOD38182.1 hypothetical protein ID128_05290 [Candidatus Wolbachia massiliensis]